MAKNPTADSFNDLFNDAQSGGAETAGGAAGIPDPSSSPEDPQKSHEKPPRGRSGGTGGAGAGRSGNGRSGKPDGKDETSTPQVSQEEQDHILKRWGGELERTGLAYRSAERLLAARDNEWQRNVRDFRRDAAALGISETLVERTILMASLRAEDLPIPGR